MSIRVDCLYSILDRVGNPDWWILFATGDVLLRCIR